MEHSAESVASSYVKAGDLVRSHERRGQRLATAELYLHRHLFGSDRVLPPRALRDVIAALQDNLCFHCRALLGAAPQADHFIPRIRCGIDEVTDEWQGDVFILAGPSGQTAGRADKVNAEASVSRRSGGERPELRRKGPKSWQL